MKILAIPGSLRANSSSNKVLQAIADMMPSEVNFTTYKEMESLPHFNDPEEAPEVVLRFREAIKESDAVLICTPEYAFGVPGALKNALDWTVGSGEFIDKPVALITASSQGQYGHAALLLILGAISANVIHEASLLISFIRAKLDDSGIKDPETTTRLREAIHHLKLAVS